MPVPGEVWQWPLLAGLLLVVGWVLWVQREERRRVAVEMGEERKRHEEQVAQVLADAEADRKRQLEAWQGVVQRSIETQVEVASGLARLCLEVERLTRAMGEEHREIMVRCIEGHARDDEGTRMEGMGG